MDMQLCELKGHVLLFGRWRVQSDNLNHRLVNDSRARRTRKRELSYSMEVSVLDKLARSVVELKIKGMLPIAVMVLYTTGYPLSQDLICSLDFIDPTDFHSITSKMGRGRGRKNNLKLNNIYGKHY